MGIAYKELFREKDRVYGFGPAGYFIRRFKKSDYSEAELLGLISGMDFSLGEADEDISLEKKCEIIKYAVTEAHYTSWVLTLISTVTPLFGLIATLVSNQVLKGLMGNQPLVISVMVTLLVLGVYALFRIRFEGRKTILLCALNHIESAKSWACGTGDKNQGITDRVLEEWTITLRHAFKSHVFYGLTLLVNAQIGSAFRDCSYECASAFPA